MPARADYPGARMASAPTRLFDIDVQTAPPAELLRRILGFAADGRSHHVSYVNAHVLNQANGDPELRSALKGSDLGSAADAGAALRRWYPRLDIRGTHHGYFELGSPHSERVLEDIAEKQPDILLVGMGTPLQERWVEHYADRLEVPVVWTVGALFDYLSHRVPRAPHWLADHGLEWVFRLALEPRRMWRRYLLGNPAFLTRVWRERNLTR